MGRLVNCETSMIGLILGACRARPCDVMSVWHPPFTTGLAAVIVSRLKRVPFVYDVQDIWPKAPFGPALEPVADRQGRPGRRTEMLERSGRTIFVSAALLQLVLRHGARIVFLSTRMDDESGPVSHLSVPAAGSSSVSGILTDFVDFIEQAGVEVGRVRRRAGVHEQL